MSRGFLRPLLLLIGVSFLLPSMLPHQAALAAPRPDLAVSDGLQSVPAANPPPLPRPPTPPTPPGGTPPANPKLKLQGRLALVSREAEPYVCAAFENRPNFFQFSGYDADDPQPRWGRGKLSSERVCASGILQLLGIEQGKPIKIVAMPEEGGPGSYMLDCRTVMIRKYSEHDQFAYILMHEPGHLLEWEECHTPGMKALKDELKQIIAQEGYFTRYSRNRDDNGAIGDWGLNSLSEDFADTSAYFLMPEYRGVGAARGQGRCAERSADGNRVSYARLVEPVPERDGRAKPGHDDWVRGLYPGLADGHRGSGPR